MSEATAGNRYGPSFVGGCRVALPFVTGSGRVPLLQHPPGKPAVFGEKLASAFRKVPLFLKRLPQRLGVLQPGLLAGCPRRWPHAPSLAGPS